MKNVAVERARHDARALADAMQCATVAEFSAAGRDVLVEIVRCRAVAGEWSYARTGASNTGGDRGRN